MPFKSRKQQDFLRINEPEIYERWMRLYGPYEGDAETWQGVSLAGTVDEISEMLDTRKKRAEGDPNWMRDPEQKRKVSLRLQKKDGVPRICEVCEDAYTGLYYYKEDDETFVVCRPCVQRSEREWGEMFGIRPDWTGERGGRTRLAIMDADDYEYVPHADCSNCGEPAVFVVYSLPVGSRYFCQERCYSDYVGLPPQPTGYYGYESEEESRWIVSSDDIQVGDKVRSYDFVLPNYTDEKAKTLQADSYVEGYVMRIEPVPESYSPETPRYHIRATARVLGGVSYDDYEDYYYPVADASHTVVRRLRRMNAETFEADEERCPNPVGYWKEPCGKRLYSNRFISPQLRKIGGKNMMICGHCVSSESYAKGLGEWVDKYGNGSRLDAENWGGDPDGQLAKALAKARAKSKEPRKPLKLTRLPHRDQKTLKDFEAPVQEEKVFTKKDIGLITFGAVLGVVSGVVGEVLAEFWLDRYRRDPELVLSDEEQNA